MKKILILLLMFCFSLSAMCMDVEYLSNGHIYKIGDMRVRYIGGRIEKIGD